MGCMFSHGSKENDPPKDAPDPVCSEESYQVTRSFVRDKPRASYCSYKSFISHDELTPDSTVVSLEDTGKTSCLMSSRSQEISQDDNVLRDENDNVILCSKFPRIYIPDEVTIYSYMKHNFVWYKDSIALVDGSSGKSFTFGDVSNLVMKVANGLRRDNFQRRDVLFVLTRNAPEYAIIFFAVAAVGGILCPLNPDISPESLYGYFRQLNASYVIATPSSLDVVNKATQRYAKDIKLYILGKSSVGHDFSSLTREVGSSSKRREIDKLAKPEDVILFLPSNDVTSRPSVVKMTQRSVVASWIQARQPGVMHFQSEEDCILSVIPFYHSFGLLHTLCSAMLQGCKVVTTPNFEMKHIFNLAQKHKVTVFPILAKWTNLVANHPSLKISTHTVGVKVIIYGDAYVPYTHEKLSRGNMVTEVKCVHGKSETCSLLAVATADTPDGSVGQPVPNTICKIVDTKTGSEVSDCRKGRVYAKGPQLTSGFLRPDGSSSRRPEAEVLLNKDGWLDTGDTGYMDINGNLFIVEPEEYLINFKEEQISPREIEKVLMHHPGIADAVVIATDYTQGRQVPRGYVTLKSGYADLTTQDILQFTNMNLPPERHLRGGIMLLEYIPRADCGLVLREQLLQSSSTPLPEAVPV